ncbi:MAG: hypothetical protein GF350_06510 [Chitinivibrionales bacterium]|nr:hypothetical protein [Chitinivibrionales bacterium]
MKNEQLTLDLFAPAPFDEILTGEQESKISITFSNKLKNGWYVLVKPVSGNRTLVIPSFLKHAPDSIKRALIDWTLLPRPRNKNRKKLVRKKKNELETRIWSYFQACGFQTSRTKTIEPEKIRMEAQGRRYNLQHIFDGINDTCFNGQISSLIRWGQFASTTSYQSTASDKYGREHNLITIAGVYDHPSVPEFAVKAVIHHEMLHIAIPPFRKNGRRVIHGAEFRKAEKAYEHYDQWRNWEKNALHTLARDLKRKRANKLLP